jgi:uncharacterized Tic20 family protein
MTIADEIEKLNRLRENGALTEDEYQGAKAKLLDSGQTVPALPAKPLDEKTWAAILHLSQFCGFVLPLAGLVVPIILWQLKKDESALLDRHGRIIANWLVTALIAGAVFWLLCFILIGIPLLAILGLLCVVFPIVGAIKASNGEAWPYPMSYRFWTLG